MKNHIIEPRFIALAIVVATVFFLTLVVLLLVQNYIATEKHNESEAELLEATNQKVVLKKDRDELLRERDQLQVALYDERHTRTLLEGDLQAKQAEAKDLYARSLTFQQKIDAVELEKNDIERRLAKANSSNAAAVQGLSEELRIAKQQIEEMTSTMRATQRTQEMIQNDTTRLQNQLRMTTEKLKETEKKLEMTEKLLAQANTTISGMTVDLQSLQGEQARLQGENENLTWSLLKSDTKLTLCRKRLSSHLKCEAEVDDAFERAESTYRKCYRERGSPPIVYENQNRMEHIGENVFSIGDHHVLIVCDSTLPEH